MNGEIPMKKKALLAVLLVMTLLLSSCSLIVKDQEVDAKTVILKMGDKEITKAEVQEATQNELASLYQTYAAYYGTQLDITDPEVIASAQSTAVTGLKQDLALRAKAAELGLDQLTDEEKAHAKEDAESGWETAKSYVQNYYLTEEQKALEGEELEKAIQEQLDSFGVTMEDYEKTAADEIVDQKLRDYAVQDVSVSDEDVKADYDSKVAADEEKYKENAASWTTASNNGTTTLYYTPAGIRRVKQILIKFKEDDQKVIDEANSKISDANSRELPVHQVTVSSFYIGQTEVTQALWQAVMGDNPSYFHGPDLPVEQISWEDCQAFIAQLNRLTGCTFRLPTEAEWEFAARGGNESQGYKYAGGNDPASVAWYSYNDSWELRGTGYYGTHAVATRLPNELMLHDMSGNVHEWCQDWYGDYSSAAVTDPTGPAGGTGRVYRGGSWYFDEWFCRVSFRNQFSPTYRSYGIGMRLAL